jgi:hypothetical protein
MRKSNTCSLSLRMRGKAFATGEIAWAVLAMMRFWMSSTKRSES